MLRRSLGQPSPFVSIRTTVRIRSSLLIDPMLKQSADICQNCGLEIACKYVLVAPEHHNPKVVAVENLQLINEEIFRGNIRKVRKEPARSRGFLAMFSQLYPLMAHLP
ncbi:hypothetical protein D5086_019958 [Populus alba]|uniref:Uncharacterized protein n=1 Tax=Populus alba TaxID=43335 RepID=A0ACC4BK69_POPAL